MSKSFVAQYIHAWNKPHWAGAFSWGSSPNSVSALGVLTVVVKDWCPIEVLIGAVGKFATVHSFTSRSSKCKFRLRRLAESGGPEQVLFETALSGLAFSFLAGAKGNLVFWWSFYDLPCLDT